MKIKLIAHNHIRPDALEQVKPLFRELIAQTHKEPGCIEYELFVDQEDSGHFTFVETWKDQAALDAHMKSEHFTRIIPQVGAYKSKEGGATKYFFFE